MLGEDAETITRDALSENAKAERKNLGSSLGFIAWIFLGAYLGNKCQDWALGALLVGVGVSLMLILIQSRSQYHQREQVLILQREMLKRLRRLDHTVERIKYPAIVE